MVKIVALEVVDASESESGESLMLVMQMRILWIPDACSYTFHLHEHAFMILAWRSSSLCLVGVECGAFDSASTRSGHKVTHPAPRFCLLEMARMYGLDWFQHLKQRFMPVLKRSNCRWLSSYRQA